MIRLIAVCILASLTVACADTTTGRAWDEPGNASYDALKQASDACKTQGGTLQLKNGGDPTRLEDYDCHKGKGG